MPMLRHYVKTAFRHLRRQKGYAFLNATGLALGLACAMLAVLYIRDETSFDAFHAGGEKLITVVTSDSLQVPTSTSTPYPLAHAIGEMPEVERTLRTNWGPDVRMRRPGGQEVVLKLLQADPSFFTFFSFPITQGSPATALDDPDAIVLTQEAAQTLFGGADPIGQTVEYYWRLGGEPGWVPLRVTALATDPPATSTLQFAAVVNLSLSDEEMFSLEPRAWGMSWLRTFARLRSSVDADAFISALPDRIASLDGARKYSNRYFVAMPLKALYFSELEEGNSFTGRRAYLRLFSVIALVVLATAVLNYVNLSTVRSLKRAREVGVRKAVGAEWSQIARQMLVEAIVLSAASFLLALALVWAVLPAFNSFFGKEVSLSAVRDIGLLGAMLGGAIATGLLAGLYPAFVLARYKPTDVLKSGAPGGIGGAWLRRGLVVTQFATTIGLLVYTGLVFQQLGFLGSQYPLPEGARLVTLDVPQEWQNRTPAIKKVLADLPGVEGVAATTGVPGRVFTYFGVKDSTGQNLTFAFVKGDRDFVRVMNLKGAEGGTGPSDLPLRLFLNEAGMRLLNKPWEPGVTAPLILGNNRVSSGGGTEIAGVIRDFPFKSLREPIEPMLLSEGSDTLGYWMVAARVKEAQLPAFLSALPGAWSQFSERPPEPQYVEDFVADLYKGETQLAQIVTFFSLLALLVACLGLFGLAAFSAAQRTKEIGIRKTLGASVGGLVGLLSKDFVVLVAAACVVSMPVAYVVARRWLEGFVEQAPITPLVFMLVGLGALALALATVAALAYRAARADPARALRYE